MRNLDIELLRSFATIADIGSFTRAGERLGRTQSAISLQIKRLEEQVGKTLFVRSPRKLAMTVEGERLIGPARQILRLHDATLAQMFEPDVAGSVRIGVPEDFATAHLPGILAAFAGSHPLVELEVTCDLTLNLVERFHAGAFDLVLVKRQPTQEQQDGVRVWREPLVWVARDRQAVNDGERLPLVVSPEPCVYRKRATDALDAMGRPWRIAYTSTSLAGSLSAVRAGLGLTVLPLEMVPSGLMAVGGQAGPDITSLPPLYDTEIALVEAPGLSDAARLLTQHITAALERGA